MCDTLVALAAATKAGHTLFAKNSDREANEAQAVEFVPAAKHPAGSRLRATYIDLPQVRETLAVVLSRPYWMWGAEMGVNECGVAIGNEAVYSRIAAQSDPALTGMDLVRLGLERGGSADAALAVIIDLLEAHGQGGNCGHSVSFYYHNSFLIADSRKAFVLETVAKRWIVQEVRATRSISNTLTIRDEFDEASAGLIDEAVEDGLLSGDGYFDFAVAFRDGARTRLASGDARYCRTRDLLSSKAGRITPTVMIDILRDHGPAASIGTGWRPDGLMNGAVCAHASFGPVRRFGQTTGSLVAELRSGEPRIWLTGTSAPCTGLFKPVFFDAIPDFGPLPSGCADKESIWWKHERLHRAVLTDYPRRLAAYRRERDAIEASFLEPVGDRRDFVSKAWEAAARATDRWIGRVGRVTPQLRPSEPYRRHWARLAREASFG